MPPLYAPRKTVPTIDVPLTPDLARHYWGLYAGLRELAILRHDMATALHCQAGMDYLLDHRDCIDEGADV